VRTAEELRENFGAREDAIQAAIEARLQARGSLSFDESRKRAIAEGRVEVDVEGNATKLTVDPELLDLQLEKFEFKFGRKPGPGDPIFFDQHADRPQSYDPDEMLAYVRAAAMATGTDPDAAVEYFFGKQDLDEYKRKRQ
jgi:hypothetical protein